MTLVKAEIQKFFIEILDVDLETCDVLFSDAYFECTKNFIQKAQAIANLSLEDIQQALRNVWVMNVFQVYFGRAISLTNAVFAYSMLYPLTDNYLDDTKISTAHKQAFNKRFYKKIKTGHGVSNNKEEALIFYMIDLIELDYPREKFPKVYESLLAILDGQNKSLGQQGMTTLYDKDLLTYTFYKGGSSVLADAYLVKGHLTHDEAKFAYLYGIILQIADDIQDIQEDLHNNHLTLANTQSLHSNLDGFYMKYEGLIQGFFQDHFPRKNDHQEALWQLLKVNMGLLNYSSLMDNKKYFSKETFKSLMRKNYFSKRVFMKHNRHLIQLVNDILVHDGGSLS